MCSIKKKSDIHSEMNYSVKTVLLPYYVIKQQAIDLALQMN